MVKVLFVHAERGMTTNLGVMYLSSMLKSHGHSCSLVYASDKRMIEKIREYSPGLIAISCTSMYFSNALRAIGRIRKHFKTPIILGGPHPTFSPEVVELEGVDMVCRGEGEHALLELANKLDSGENIARIRNLWVKKGRKIYRNPVRPLVEDLDSLPQPDRKLYSEFYSRRAMMVFMSSRGCPFSCSFCFNHQMRKLYKNRGKYIRRRKVSNLISEIVKAKEAYGFKRVYFSDDTFTLDREWVMEFCKQYRDKVNLPMTIQTRADLIDDEVIKHLKEAGCNYMHIGIECGNEDMRNSLLNKQLSNSQITKAFRILKKNGIETNTYNIVGLPGETAEDVTRTIEFNIKLRPSSAFFVTFQPYPRLELTDIAIRGGYLKPGEVDYSLGKGVRDSPDIHALKAMAPMYVKFPILYRFNKYIMKSRITRNKHIDTLLMVYNTHLLSKSKKFYRNRLRSILRIASDFRRTYSEIEF